MFCLTHSPTRAFRSNAIHSAGTELVVESVRFTRGPRSVLTQVAVNGNQGNGSEDLDAASAAALDFLLKSSLVGSLCEPTAGRLRF